jgi:hypothetical protein
MRASVLILALLCLPTLVAQDVDQVWFELDGSASEGGIPDSRGSGVNLPNLVLDANGHPLVCWLKWDSSAHVHRWNGESWERIFGAGCAQYGLPPGLGVDSLGQITLAWATDFSMRRTQIYVGRWNGSDFDGLGHHSAWAGGISANSGSSNIPAMVFDTSDHPVVAWMDRSMWIRRIYIRRFDGSQWQEFGVDSAQREGIARVESFYHRHRIALALDPWDNPVVAWSDDGDIYLLRWNGSEWEELGGSGSGRGVSNRDDSDFDPAVAVGPDGQPIVAWSARTRTTSETKRHIYLRRWNGSVWEEMGGSATGGGISDSPGEAQWPSLAVDSLGNPIVAWDHFETYEHIRSIWIRRWNGVRWEEIGEGSAQDQGISGEQHGEQPRLVVDPMGNPAVAWAGPAIYFRTTGPGLLWEGDCNLEFPVDAADLVALTNHLAGTGLITHPIALRNADLTGDDEIAEDDLDALVDLLLGRAGE